MPGPLALIQKSKNHHPTIRFSAPRNRRQTLSFLQSTIRLRQRPIDGKGSSLLMEALSDRASRLQPRTICIIKPSSLGDIIHSLPILPALRRLFPSAHVSWVVNAVFRSLIDGHPDLDRVIAFERGGSHLSPRGALSTARLCGRLFKHKYDLTIDLQGLLRSGLMTAATRAPIRVGMADAREGAGLCYTHRVDASRHELHAVDRIRKVVAALGLVDFEPSFHIPTTAHDRQWAAESLAAVARPRLVFNLGARWLTKRWPPEHFAELARRAVSEFGVGLIAVGSSSDRPLVADFRKHLGNLPLLDLSGQTSLHQLAAVAEQSDLFVSNDTGPLHVAAAAGASVVGIYTCTSPRLTGPYGPRAATVESCVWCAASLRKSCDRLECFSELSPDRVWPVVRNRLLRSLEPAA
jgi:lipopolysaccharide heptosyltransferase I